MISMELRKIWGSENARGSLFDVNREFGHTNIKNLLRVSSVCEAGFAWNLDISNTCGVFDSKVVGISFEYNI